MTMNFLADFDEVEGFVVLIHEIRWPLIEPARLQAAHGHLKQVVAMSRASWKSILAETSDDREWIPGPQQKNGVMTSMPVTQAQVDGWRHALDVAVRAPVSSVVDAAPIALVAVAGQPLDVVIGLQRRSRPDEPDSRDQSCCSRIEPSGDGELLVDPVLVNRVHAFRGVGDDWSRQSNAKCKHNTCHESHLILH
jgi:hypothetical protein